MLCFSICVSLSELSFHFHVLRKLNFSLHGSLSAVYFEVSLSRSYCSEVCFSARRSLSEKKGIIFKIWSFFEPILTDVLRNVCKFEGESEILEVTYEYVFIFRKMTLKCRFTGKVESFCHICNEFWVVAQLLQRGLVTG